MAGGIGWRKAKLALRSLNLCISSPPVVDSGSGATRLSFPAPAEPSDSRPNLPSTNLTRSSSTLQSRTPTSTSRLIVPNRTCAVCSETMKATKQGHEIFTAECSHSFHFHCIASRGRFGDHVICPVCRAKWKEILPFQNPPNLSRSKINSANLPRHDDHTTARHPLHDTAEPVIYNDDEVFESPSTEASGICRHESAQEVEIKLYPEYSAISQLASAENFTILVHLKAPLAGPGRAEKSRKLNVDGDAEIPNTPRAPVDLVTVLDVSCSMSGRKLALLKQAMGFVIQNLGPSDRLSVIAFSSTARRLFPLRRMCKRGRRAALEAVTTLSTSGGTNITEGLRKGAKVIEERKDKNPVCSIILLSDGQDTYILSPGMRSGRRTARPDYRSILPSSVRDGTISHRLPIHVFGFGVHHDSASMHSISDDSGGTFSFIESDNAIQDAFAQCIGGLLSVMVREMHVRLECLHPNVRLRSIKSGKYFSRIADDGRRGGIDAGDLYADEERDYLVSVSVPHDCSAHATPLLRVSCAYRDPVTGEMVSPDEVRVKISRPLMEPASPAVSIEVDRQRNRIHAANAMAEARALAEQGGLAEAVGLLEDCRKRILTSEAGKTGDQLCVSLDRELKEMQERMVDRQRYEVSGRAYLLSGLSSHLCQRATVRGELTGSGNFVQTPYQTPSMVDMLQRSQTFCCDPVARRSNRRMRQAMSFPAEPKPR